MAPSAVLYMALLRDVPAPTNPEKAVVFLAAAHDVSSLNVVVRNSAKEILRFSARSVAVSLQPGKMVKAGVNQDVQYCVYGLKDNSGTTAVLAASENYPVRYAGHYLKQMLELAAGAGPRVLNIQDDVVAPKVDGGVPSLCALITEAQTPEKNDKLVQLKADLDETRNIACMNLEKMMERGQQLDDILKRSDDLSAASKMFLKEAKKTRCRFCAVM